MVGRGGPSRHPDRLVNRTSEPASTSSSWTPPSTPSWPTACSSTSRPPTSIVATTSRPYVRQTHRTSGSTDHLHPTPQTTRRQTTPTDTSRAALDRRGNQLMVVELRPTAPQHRPQDPPPSRRRCAWPPPSSPSANSSPTATDGAPTDHLPARALRRGDTRGLDPALVPSHARHLPPVGRRPGALRHAPAGPRRCDHHAEPLRLGVRGRRAASCRLASTGRMAW